MSILHKEKAAKKNTRIVKKSIEKKATVRFTESEELTALSGKVLTAKKHKEAEAFFRKVRSAE